MQRLGVDVAEALVRVEDPKIVEYNIRSNPGLFSGGMELATTGFTAGGYRSRIRTQKARSTHAMGATSGATAIPSSSGGLRYEDILYKREHFNDILATVGYEEQFVDYVNKAPTYQDGLEDIASMLMTQVLEDYAHTVNILQVTNRVGILGTIVAITNMAGTTLTNANATDEAADFGLDPILGTAFTGKWKFILELGVDAIINAFEVGMRLSIAAPPQYYGLTTYAGAGVATVRNNIESAATGTYGSDCTIKVDGMPEVLNALSANGGTIKVPCALYYTAANKATNLILCYSFAAGAVGTGDVVGLFSGNIATSTTATTEGFNFGIQGLLHWFDRANISTAAGACSTALYDSQGNAISRLATGNMAFWYPYVNEGGSALVTNDMVQTVYRNMSYRKAKNSLPIANNLIVTALAKEIGGGPYRANLGSWDASTTEKWQSYGYSGVAIQGPGLLPLEVALSDWIPSNMVPFVDPAVFVLMSPKAGEWKPQGTGSVWFPKHNSSGQRLLASEALWMRGVQMHAYDLWNVGGVVHTKPATA